MGILKNLFGVSKEKQSMRENQRSARKILTLPPDLSWRICKNNWGKNQGIVTVRILRESKRYA
mgnify:CR=1 FL=1